MLNGTQKSYDRLGECRLNLEVIVQFFPKRDDKARGEGERVKVPNWASSKKVSLLSPSFIIRSGAMSNGLGETLAQSRFGAAR